MDSVSRSADATFHEGETVVGAVVTALADAKGVSVLDIEPPLASVVNPDALEKLVASMDSHADSHGGTVTFTHGEYTVTVSADGCASATRTANRN